MKVYCTSQPTTPFKKGGTPTSTIINPSDFKEYGEPVYFLPHWETSSLTKEELDSALEEFLADFDLYEDTLLPLGSPRVIVAATTVLNRKGPFSYLVWSRRLKTYSVHLS